MATISFDEVVVVENPDTGRSMLRDLGTEPSPAAATADMPTQDVEANSARWAARLARKAPKINFGQGENSEVNRGEGIPRQTKSV